QDFTFGRFDQSDQVAEQRTLAAPAASHDYEDISMPDSEIQIPHQHKTAISHRKIADDDMGLTGGSLSRLRRTFSHNSSASDAEQVGYECKQTASQYHEHDRSHHRTCGSVANRRRTVPALKTL